MAQSTQISQDHVSRDYELPVTVAQQVETFGLGRLLDVYRPLFSNSMAIAGMVIGAVIVDLLLLFMLERFTNHLYFYYGLVYMPILVIVYGIYAFMISDLRIYEFPDGLVRVKGERIDLIRWDQVISVTQQQKRKAGHYDMSGEVDEGMLGNNAVQIFTVYRADGKNFKFTGMVRRLDQLHQNVQEVVAQQHLPRAIAAYQRGAILPFGPFTVSLQGLSNGRRIVVWEDMQDVEIKQGLVIIKKAGSAFAWAEISVSQIPNLLVFMKLVHYVRTGKTSY